MSQSWLSNALAIVGLAAALVFFLKSRLRPRPSCMVDSSIYIGYPRRDQATQRIKILFDDEEVTLIVATLITFWNAGNATLRREDVASVDPISFKFEDGRVLVARINRISRSSNDSHVSLIPDSPEQVRLEFEFLDPGDGVEIVVIHTSGNLMPSVRGTIKGVKKGIKMVKRQAGRRLIEYHDFRVVITTSLFLYLCQISYIQKALKKIIDTVHGASGSTALAVVAVIIRGLGIAILVYSAYYAIARFVPDRPRGLPKLIEVANMDEASVDASVEKTGMLRSDQENNSQI